MSAPATLAEIIDVQPEMPPFIPDLIGKFDTVWWVFLVGAIIAVAVGIASYRGVIRLRTSTEFHLLAGGAGFAAVAIGGLWIGS